MPILSITALERRLAATVKETTSSRPKLQECEAERGSGGLACVALPPARVCEAPSDLDGGREVGVEGNRAQPDEADEGLAPLHLDRPQPIAVLIEVSADASHEDFALLARGGRGEVLHHPQVGIQFREGVEVRIPPRAQQQSLGLDRLHLRSSPLERSSQMEKAVT